MVVLITLLLFIFFLIALYFKKKGILVKGLLITLFLISIILILGVLTNPTMKHFYNIVEHDIIRYEIKPLASSSALPRTVFKKVIFKKSGMYELVLVKNNCFRDNKSIYKTTISLQKDDSIFQNISYDRQSHQLGDKKCKFPYAKSYVLGFLNIPFSLNDQVYDILIDIQSDTDLISGDRIIIRQSLYK